VENYNGRIDIVDQDSLNAPELNAPMPSDYMSELEGEDLTEAQKIELLETLFNIMKTFVDIGYGMEPVNKLIEDFEKCASESPNMIGCKNSEKGGYYE